MAYDAVAALSKLNFGGAAGTTSQRRSSSSRPTTLRSPKGGASIRRGRVTEADALLLKGDAGAEAAASTLKRIQNSDAPEDLKRAAQELFATGNGGGHGGGGLFHALTHNPLTDAIGTGLNIIDKPKRAVVATEEAILDKAGVIDKNESWLDRVLRDKSFGYGDVWRDIQDEHNIPKNTWLDRAIGLTGDVASDPLSYLGVGVVDDAVRGGSSIGKGVAATEDIAKLDKGVEAARAGRGLTQRLKLDPSELARRAENIGDFELGKKVAQGGRSAATGDELARLGAKGGVRLPEVLGGATIIPQDLARLTGLPGQLLKKKLFGTAFGKDLLDKFGSEELKNIRRIIRDPEQDAQRVVEAVRLLDAEKLARPRAAAWKAARAAEAHDLLAEGHKAGLSPVEVRTAILDPTSREAARVEQKAPGLIAKWDEWHANFRETANKLAEEPFIGQAADDEYSYVARILTDEAQAEAGKRAGGLFKETGHELRRLKAGDEYAGQILGSPELEDQFGRSIESQVEGLMKQSGRVKGDVYLNDLAEIVPRYIEGVGKRLKGKFVQQHMRGAGFIEDIPLVEKGSEAATKRGVSESFQARRAAGGARREADAAKREVQRLDVDIDKLGTAQSPGRGSLAAEPIEELSRREKAAASLAPLLDQAEESVQINRADPEGVAAEVKRRIDQDRIALTKVSPKNPARYRALESSIQLREQALKLLERLHPEVDAGERASVALAIARNEAEARWNEALNKAVDMEAMVRALPTPEFQTQFKRQLSDGFVQFGRDTEQAPEWMVDAFQRAAEVYQDPTVFGKFVNSVNRVFKTYAILSPGFHVRNHMGAFFNNFAADVDVSSYAAITKAIHQWRRKGIEGVDEGIRPFFERIVSSGEFDDVNRATGEAADFATGAGGHIRPSVGAAVRADPGERLKAGIQGGEIKLGPTDNPLTRFSRRIGDRVEDYHRATIMYDTLKKGGNMEHAYERMYHMHFDYGDLSSFETKYLRRFIPFWTWTSRNLPLQVEMLMRNPRTYERFNILKDNLQSGNEDPGAVVPDWLKNTSTAINIQADLPVIGKVDYAVPDLPFQSADDTLDAFRNNPSAALFQDSAPIFKTPIEAYQNQQFFANLPLSQRKTPAPEAWKKIPGLLRGLQQFGLASKGKDEQWLMSGENAYVVEQALPLLGRFRRLFPSEEKYDARATASWLSFIGLGSRNVTSQDKTNELFRRNDELKNLYNLLVDQGYIEPSTSTRRKVKL